MNGTRRRTCTPPHAAARTARPPRATHTYPRKRAVKFPWWVSFLDSASSPIYTYECPHGAYAWVSGRDRIDPHRGGVERLAARIPLAEACGGALVLALLACNVLHRRQGARPVAAPRQLTKHVLGRTRNQAAEAAEAAEAGTGQRQGQRPRPRPVRGRVPPPRAERPVAKRRVQPRPVQRAPPVEVVIVVGGACSRNKGGNIFREGIFLDSARLTTRTMHPHAGPQYVREARRNRIDPHGGWNWTAWDAYRQRPRDCRSPRT